MPGPLRCAAWLDELVSENGTALRTLHDADDDRRCDDEYAVNRFELAGWHVDAPATRTDSGVRSREAESPLQVGDTYLKSRRVRSYEEATSYCRYRTFDRRNIQTNRRLGATKASSAALGEVRL